ncbi:type II-A CRISPR-associated protein Csn2 [Butyrivibrio sp. NC3005]|uniref:type II-A CRISPR-associated protein Csn2 n=1 Tax=Butyrivibrio sp. NC3005 TaxID=1280685 RepID=UPI00041529F3|nr:type II-A CRISPR-associated protein Csn2 [Butyrivibrio sp. NC3005]
MRFYNKEYNLEIVFIENVIVDIVCENKKAFGSMILDLISETASQDGAWILSENEDELSISKLVEIIVNPFEVTCNDKKIINAIYKELKSIIDLNYPELYAKANSEMIEMIDAAVMDVPYQLEYELDGALENIFKIYSIRFDEKYTSLLDRVISYMKNAHQVLHKKIFVFVNLKSFMEDSEIQMLYEAAKYEKVFLIILESQDNPKLNDENKMIIDKDLCIIKV